MTPRPTPRELAHQFARSVGMQNDVNFKELLEAAITRDREQGRAADAAEIASLRKALDRAEVTLLAFEEVTGLLLATGHHGYPVLFQRMEIVRGMSRSLRTSLAAPLAPATTGKEQTK